MFKFSSRYETQLPLTQLYPWLYQQSADSTSHSNHHEASFLAQLARHLLLQGYKDDKITVINAYAEQLRIMKKVNIYYIVDGQTCVE